MPLHKNSRLILCFLVVSALATTSLECQALLENFRTMRIDPVTLKAELDGLLPLCPSPDREFYRRSNSYTPTIAHLGPDGSYIPYNVFEVNPDGTLSHEVSRKFSCMGLTGLCLRSRNITTGSNTITNPWILGLRYISTKEGMSPHNRPGC